jgi:diacylglycerol kinase family enzyme
LQAVLIENPKAGGVSAASVRVAERALAATFDLEVASTTERGHATELAREAVEAGAKTVISYGGDGTTNEILNGLLGTSSESDVVLAVLPGGTTNVLARNLGFPNDLVEATAHLIEVVERGGIHPLDIGRLEAQTPGGKLRRNFLFAAGLVFDADIVRRVDKPGGSKRVSAFAFHGLRSFFAVRGEGPPRLRLETPSGPEELYWACLATQDPYTYAGRRPLRALPRNSSQQGSLHLLASRQMRITTTLRWLSQALSTAKHVAHPDALHLTGLSEVNIQALCPVHLQADGEYIGEVSELRATSLPGALPVWA